jgi:hypothetical protein
VKLVKTLGLALVAVCATTAFLGAGTASAHPFLGFCKVNEPLLCVNKYTIPENGAAVFLAESKNATLSNNAFFKTAETCEVSKTAVEAKEEMKNPISGNITELTFTGCSGPCTTATAQGLPWKGKLSMAEEGGTKYSLTAEEGKVLLSGCTFGTKCEYGVPAGGLTLVGENTAEGGVVNANGVTVAYKGGSGEFVCGSSGTWTASYKALKGVHLIDETGAETLHESKWWFTLLGTTGVKS